MIYEGITRQDYYKLDGINHSSLKYFRDSIKHGAHRLNTPIRQSSAMALGCAVHTAVLEPHKFDEEYLVGGPINERTNQPYGRQTKAFQQWKDKQGPDKTVIGFEDVEICDAVKSAVTQHADAQRILNGADLREFALTWTDAETGLSCKCLVDFGARSGYIGDLKTISKPLDYDTLSRALYTYGYHSQFAFYADGARANGIFVDEFIIIFAQTIDENDIAVCRLGEQSLHYGQMNYRKCLDNFAKFKAGESSTGYHSGMFDLDVPYWSMSEFMDIEESGLMFEETV